MRRDPRKSDDEKQETKPVTKQLEKDGLEKETVKNSTTSGTIQPEALIVSGLVLSVVTQIAFVSLLTKDTNK